ncbi:hypothetical protein [Nonlabens xiamenensis]|uniref:hypothetical protein n=1 Tax=Nonlabens xiamenensis TaxID=2341043 RepID=UPI000F60753E|nr:hypothetical protein [Nonlabens xiamenensis]
MRELYTVVCCLLFFGAFAQYQPDFNKAPENPVADMHTLDAEHVKGDVYAIDGQIYDKQGKHVWNGHSGKIYEVCAYTKQEAKKLNSSYCLRDNKGRLVEKGYFKDGVLSFSSYTYINDLLIRIEHSSNIQNFEYDAKGRIIKEIITYKASKDRPEKSTYGKYTYQPLDDGVLKVNTERQNYDGSISNYAYHYKNGLPIYSVDDDYEYEYKFDDKGNWVYNRFSKNEKFGKKERSIIYYSDFDNPKFHFEPDPSITSSPILFPYVNGKILRGSKIEVIGKNDQAYMFHYLPEVNYYIIPDAKALSILGGKVTKANAQAVYNTQMAYYRNIAGKSYVVYDEGEKLKDYSHFGKWIYLENGDPVITVNNKPTYILNDYYQAKDKELKPVLPYNGEPLDKKSTKTNTVDVVEFQPSLPLLVARKSNNTFEFSQKDKNLAIPAYLKILPNEKDAVAGYGNYDYLIRNIYELPVDVPTEVPFAAKEGELLLVYDQGKLTHFYNFGKALTKDEYKIYTTSPGKWMVYLTQLNLTMHVDKERPGYSGYAGSPVSQNLYFAYKTAKGLSVLTPTGYLKNNIYKWSLKNGTAQIFINGKLSYELANYSNLKNENVYALSLTGQSQSSMVSTGSSTSSSLSEKAKKYVEMRALGSYKARPLFAKEIESFKAAGKSQEQIDQYYLEIFNELYHYDFEEGFEFMMLVPTDISKKLLPKIDADKRSAIRTRSREELKKYKSVKY